MVEVNGTTRKSEVTAMPSWKAWVMAVVTLVCAVLYEVVLVGRIEPLKDASVVTRFEPIIFVIVGYFYGQIAAQANEIRLRHEINRQSQKADAAQQIKESAQQERETLEEKIRNAKIVLMHDTPSLGAEKHRDHKSLNEKFLSDAQAVEIARKILDS